MSHISDRIHKSVRSYYPAIVNGTANPIVLYLVNLWLNHRPADREELEKLQVLYQDIQKQPDLSPSPNVYQQIREQLMKEAVSPAKAAVQWQLWLVPLFLLLVAGFVLQRALPPVIPVNWTVSGQEVESFRVYRIPSGVGDDLAEAGGELIYEISANSSNDNYGFKDPLLFPRSQVIYRIEALGQDGLLAATATRIGDGFSTSLGQILLISIFILIGYVLWFISRQTIAKKETQHFDLA